MKQILGIFRGFPGLGRVVAGVSILEKLRDQYGYSIRLISYLQGRLYLQTKGYIQSRDVSEHDYCSIGLLPTNTFGADIHAVIKEMRPDMVIIDGEPLMIQSIKISFPTIKIVTLLNPSDVDNPHNDVEAMDFFNAQYTLADLAIVHGLREVRTVYPFKELLSINTIIRNEIFSITNHPTNDIYCVLGGGTVNVTQEFESDSLRIADKCIDSAQYLDTYNIHIICSSANIYSHLNRRNLPANVYLHGKIQSAESLYANACLVITRAGRNSLSELAFLGIPTISFVTGCRYRKEEQRLNIQSLAYDNITVASLEVPAFFFFTLCVNSIAKGRCHNGFLPGNEKAIHAIKCFL